MGWALLLAGQVVAGEVHADLAGSCPVGSPVVPEAGKGAEDLMQGAEGVSGGVVSWAVAECEQGLASWYGARFHGRRTASGEHFDIKSFTAAHPTWPLGTRVRVTQISSGRSVIVRVNDRGPFHGRRVLDVSRAAAEVLGLISKGKMRVRVERLEPQLSDIQAN